MLLWINK